MVSAALRDTADLKDTADTADARDTAETDDLRDTTELDPAPGNWLTAPASELTGTDDRMAS